MCKDGKECIKFLVYLLNACLFVLGIIIAGVAGYTAFNTNSALHHAIVAAHIPGTMTGIYIMFAGGIAIAVIAILVCLAASSENKLLLWLTFFFILLLLIMQLVGKIMCFYKFKVVEKHLSTLVKESAVLAKVAPKSFLSAAASLVRTLIAKLETKHKCCGFNGPSDYGSNIPNSCRPPSKHKRNSSPNAGDQPLEEGVGELQNENTEQEKAGVQGAPAVATELVLASLSSTTVSTTTKAVVRQTESATEPAPKPPSAMTYMTDTSTESTSATTGNPSVVTSEVATPQVATASNSTTSFDSPATASILPAPYKIGCFQRYKPMVYAAGGVGIAVLITEFTLLICLGLLLCDVGKGYESIA